MAIKMREWERVWIVTLSEPSTYRCTHFHNLFLTKTGIYQRVFICTQQYRWHNVQYDAVIKQCCHASIDDNSARLVQFIEELTGDQDYYEGWTNCLLTREDVCDVIELLATD